MMEPGMLRGRCAVLLAGVAILMSPRRGYCPDDGEAYEASFGVGWYHQPPLGYYAAYLADPTPKCLGGGVYHLRVGETVDFCEYRQVTRQDETVSDNRTWHFQPASHGPDPDNPPDDFYEITSVARVGTKNQTDFTDVDGWITPSPNPAFNYQIIVVAGWLTIPAAIPRNVGDQPVTLSWAVQPSATVLAPIGGPVFIDMWDPSHLNHRKKWWFNEKSGNIQWSGLLDHYCYPEEIMPDATDYAYCRASQLFWRMWVRVRDTNVMPASGAYAYDKYLMFEPYDLAIFLTDDEGYTVVGEPWPDVQAGVDFNVSWSRLGGYLPITFELRADRAFRTDATLPFEASELIHPVGSFFVPTGAPYPVVEGVYETGSRVETGQVPGTDFGPRTITLDGWDGNLVRETAAMTVEVMRDVVLTAYFTPYERNPSYIGQAANYAQYDPVNVNVWTAQGNVTIWVDRQFRDDIAEPLQGGGFRGMEGYGRLFRYRLTAQPCDNLVEPPAERAYLRWNDGASRFEFDSAPRNAQNPATILTANSTARNVQANRSYFNNMGNYDIASLQQRVGHWINNRPEQYRPNPPPDLRIIDDSGGVVGEVPQWLDIHFTPQNADFGITPELIENFERKTRWIQFGGGFPDEPIKARLH